MTELILTCEDDGQTLGVDVAAVSGLDALVYEQTTGRTLDAQIGAMIVMASQDGFMADGWPLAERATLRWLWTRQNVDADASLAVVAAGVRMMYVDDPAPVAGVVDAPEVASV